MNGIDAQLALDGAHDRMRAHDSTSSRSAFYRHHAVPTEGLPRRRALGRLGAQRFANELVGMSSYGKNEAKGQRLQALAGAGTGSRLELHGAWAGWLGLPLRAWGHDADIGSTQ